MVESLKVITYEKSLRTAQYAFEFAFLNNRKKVSAIHKANIMKQGDGLFLKVRTPPYLIRTARHRRTGAAAHSLDATAARSGHHAAPG